MTDIRFCIAGICQGKGSALLIKTLDVARLHLPQISQYDASFSVQGLQRHHSKRASSQERFSRVLFSVPC